MRRRPHHTRASNTTPSAEEEWKSGYERKEAQFVSSVCAYSVASSSRLEVTQNTNLESQDRSVESLKESAVAFLLRPSSSGLRLGWPGWLFTDTNHMTSLEALVRYCLQDSGMRSV